jgi:hypothetical protein
VHVRQQGNQGSNRIRLDSTKQPGHLNHVCLRPPAHFGAICSPCRLHISAPDPSLSETGRNLECYPTNGNSRVPCGGSSRSMASALVHFTRPSTNLLLRWVVRKWDCPCAFVNTPDISWRMLFSCEGPTREGLLDSSANSLQPIQLCYNNSCWDGILHGLTWIRRPIPTSILGPIKKDQIYLRAAESVTISIWLSEQRNEEYYSENISPSNEQTSPYTPRNHGSVTQTQQHLASSDLRVSRLEHHRDNERQQN